MKATTLSYVNFRKRADSFPIEPITVLLGKNGSGKFFLLHSSQWPINDGYTWAIDLMAKLRQAIKIIEIEQKAEEQKRLYKLSEKGF